jgi:hypothetical protein
MENITVPKRRRASLGGPLYEGKRSGKGVLVSPTPSIILPETYLEKVVQCNSVC